MASTDNTPTTHTNDLDLNSRYTKVKKTEISYARPLKSELPATRRVSRVRPHEHPADTPARTFRYP